MINHDDASLWRLKVFLMQTVSGPLSCISKGSFTAATRIATFNVF
jgi:hypothetical protein